MIGVLWKVFCLGEVWVVVGCLYRGFGFVVMSFGRVFYSLFSCGGELIRVGR